MTQEEILEGNKLIAEFLGAKMIVENYHGINIIKFLDESTKDLYGLLYHSSWDWLMPVVEKIESLGFYVNIKTKCVSIMWDNKGTNDSTMVTCEFGDYTKIERVYMCVVSFVKYHKFKTNKNNNG